jgi:Domain of unknown function (DUF4234)/Short C-terminal domain
VATHEVPLREGTGFVKVRSPVWVVVWTVLSLGIYGAYWWYQVNREMRDLGRARGREDLGDSPGTSLLAVTLGALIIVPPFVSLYKGCQRAQAAQEIAGVEERDRLNGWLALVLVVVGFALVFVPLVIAYFQSELNKVWLSEAITDDPAGVLQRGVPPAVAAPAAPQAAAAPPVPPPPPQPGMAPPPAPPPPPAASSPPQAADPQLERLERLAALRDSGALSAEEYEAQKAKILSDL